MAASAVANEARRNEFEPSVVVNEVYLRLVQQPERRWSSRRHFFGAVARAMEQFLIDAARSFARKKRKAVFIDDSPQYIASAYEYAPEVHLIHFLHDERFARHIAPLDYVSLRTGRWDEAKPHVMALIGA